MADFADIVATPMRRLRAGRLVRASGLIWVLLAMCVAAALISTAFLNPFNLINVARQIALFGIVSVGMTFVILTAGIDLSVGSIVAVAAVVSAMLLDAGVPVPLVIMAGLAIGMALGAINGAGITLGRMPPFIMTLGMMVMGRGLAMTISDGHPVHFRKDASAEFRLARAGPSARPAGAGLDFRRGRRVGLCACCATRRSAATSMRSAATRRRPGSPASMSRLVDLFGLCHQRLAVGADARSSSCRG